MIGENQKHSFELNMEIKYDDQFLEDILVTALEGGSNYWIDHIQIMSSDKPKGLPTSILAFDVIKGGGEVKIFPINESGDPDDADEPSVLSLPKLESGVQMFVDDSRIRNSIDLFDSDFNLDAGNFDADMADCVLQFALFGEVVYG